MVTSNHIPLNLSEERPGRGAGGTRPTTPIMMATTLMMATTTAIVITTTTTPAGGTSLITTIKVITTITTIVITTNSGLMTYGTNMAGPLRHHGNTKYGNKKCGSTISTTMNRPLIIGDFWLMKIGGPGVSGTAESLKLGGVGSRRRIESVTD